MKIHRISKDWVMITSVDGDHEVVLHVEVALGGITIWAHCRDCGSFVSYVGRKWVRGRGHVVGMFELPQLEEAKGEQDETF